MTMKLCIEWLLGLPIFRNTVASITVHTQSDIPFTIPVFNHACSAPLTSLLLDTDLLLENTENLNVSTLKRMRASVQRLHALMNSLSQTKNETFCIKEVLDNCILMFSHLAEITVEIDNRENDGLCCTGSKILFSEVLVCLLKNAIEAYESHQKKVIFISVKVASTGTKIAIMDHGRGMNVIERWISCLDGVSYKKKSTGIGLPFCIKTIKQYFDGSVSLSSMKQVGTSVCLYLPH
ncbi:MAG: hypothetical protein CO156_04040 [Candidatus Pacebacteria bacterium CG_4_9_14_3_um_filter_40_12]|nr:MAG: hypothetical protein COU64_05480 [Candidatus Pacebacteria bacterium CG10_big_fil_rev_8_21_14_0_10_40_26]PIZ78305.1 MAG: hypothetical protein COY01_06005 [Candidatus Pacebacteria bacterium CG_4_10_14_0_2_um_filter_40_20]PJA68651.1 MAG: hypothetical protein CO156_04040 [Candidatus Pacebacteria bacterium CG_4_9_14_3_um_filter_40_12]PJC41591.1 MAG: hypothetical protein CO041_02630 [Candidatus Pacebacteria bacterium CG_4_9_14_0_2_um_filter_40_15]